MIKRNLLYFSSDNDRRRHIDAVITYFEQERDEEIGYIAAENLLDFFLEHAGKDVYRKGIEDARKHIITKHEDLIGELDIITPVRED